jgi:hypothetical protein
LVYLWRIDVTQERRRRIRKEGTKKK